MSDNSSIKIVVTTPGWKSNIENIVSKEFDDVEFVVCENKDQCIEEIRDADAALLGLWDAEILASAEKLKWVHSSMGGVTGLIFPEFKASSLVFTCGKPIFSIPASDTAFLAMFMFSRKFHYSINASPEDEGFFDGFDHIYAPEDLSSKTVGIIGMGEMGKEVSKNAKAFGMKVFGIARTARTTTPEYVDQMFFPDQMSQLLGMSDYVVVAIPDTVQNYRMINETIFRCMKDSAYLIDCSGRAMIYDWLAMEKAINEKWISGVCLQPSGNLPDIGMPSPDSPFWRLDNVVMTPCRGTSVQAAHASLQLYIENIRRFKNGEPLKGLVDKQAGY